MRHWYGHGYGHGMSAWGIGLLAFGMLLVLLALVAVAVFLVRQSRTPAPPPKGPWAGGGPVAPHAPPPPPPPLPEQLLAERFARGEIDAEEYRPAERAAARTPGRGPPGPGADLPAGPRNQGSATRRRARPGCCPGWRGSTGRPRGPS